MLQRGKGSAGQTGSDTRPYWSRVLRALREARGVTQEGWAAALGTGRTTVQRWERGEAPPDAIGEGAIVAYCEERGLFRRFDQGPLTGITLTPEMLRDTLAEARLEMNPGHRTSTEAGASPPVDAGVESSYRRTFVGREAEVSQLQRTFDAALAGRGSLAIVVGEPGIGKTAVCEQLATYVSLRGGKALVGHSYEEGSLSLPYLAFVEAMRSYVVERDVEGLRTDLGSGAAEVARIVSEVGDRLQVELEATLDPEDARWRLLQAVTTFLKNIASVQPLLIVLEDLQWADSGTLNLLLHLVRNLGGSRLLVVGTYRDVEVDRNHPLSGILAELRRVDSFQRIPLRGLTPDEVQRMMSALASQEVSGTTATAVHNQTEGNPLFVQEVQRYLVEEGLIVREGGRWRVASETTPISMSLPEGLRDVIGKRLARLSPECNRILAVAAVIGRDFGLSMLQAVTQQDEEAVVSAIEEAEKVRILQDQSRPGLIQYRFAHALFRQTLYEELSAPRRRRLHQGVARVLEVQYARRLEDHAAELAEHFSHSTDPADLAKAVTYGEKAAQHAMSVFDYGEAVRLIDRAIDAQEVLNPEDLARLYDLKVALCRALMPFGELQAAVQQTLPGAYAIAEGLGDSARAAEACILALEALHRFGASSIRGSEEWRDWSDKLSLHAATGTSESVIADVAAGDRLSALDRFAEAYALYYRALDLARRLGDSDALIETVCQILGWGPAPGDLPKQLSLAAEFHSWPMNGASTSRLIRLFLYAGWRFLDAGNPTNARDVWARLTQIARTTHDANAPLYALRTEMIKDVLDGRLEEAASQASHYVIQADQAGSPVLGARFAFTVLARLAVYLGRPEAANNSLPVADMSDTLSLLMWSAPRVLLFCTAGRSSEAHLLLRGMVDGKHEGGTIFDAGTPTSCFVYLLEAALILKDLRSVAILVDLLAPAADAGVSDVALTSVARHLGAGCALLGDPNAARSYYHQALEISGRIGFRPEVALTRLQLAELLLEHYPEERAAAIEHLDFAIGEFRDMKMQPSLEQALRHRGLLKS